jgi:hypothetical protein
VVKHFRGIQMGKIIGYAVESGLEGGFLVHASPSVWVTCLESTVRYETAALAWASAKRRGSALASAIAVIEHDDGSLSWEPIPDPSKASGGDWIVWFELKPGARRLYVVKTGKRIAASNQPGDAKGYKTRGAAEKIAEKLSLGGSPSGVQHITAEIVPIK